ncbi:MAG: GntR family transcriptional regulator [Ignavibacteria bacterium]|nr:GntR family transcriptional regulator [Ignavibacteria bacterium]
MITASLIVQKIVIQLRKDITSGILKEGFHITEASVARNLKASRVPVREAFRILESEGYIEIIHNRGSFVKKILRSNIIENTDIYTLLAPYILRKAIPKYTKSVYKKAHAILDKIENCEEYCESSYLIWDFTKVIYSPAKLEMSMKIINDIYGQSIRLLNEFFESEQNAKFKIEVHRKFLILCEEKKGEEAIELWINFINEVKEILLVGRPD